MKAVGNPSLCPFLFNQVITCCLKFMHAVFSFSLSVLLLPVMPFEVLGSPVVFKGSAKGSLTVLSKAGRGTNLCYHLSSPLCVNTAGVTVLTPRHLTPCLYIVPSCWHTHINVTEQMHTLGVVLVPAYTHSGTCAQIV